MSTPSGMRLASAAWSSGSVDANSSASSSRNSSGRASGSVRSSASSMRFSARLAMAVSFFRLLLARVRRGQRVGGGLRWALAKIQRRKRLFLVQLDLALAHQFQRRGETGGEHGGLLRRIDDVVHEVFVEAAPVFGHADEAL